MGASWLDVSRYAGSSGTMTYAWRYRDYPINSPNRDLPFNQFAHEQLDEDLFPSPGDEHPTCTLTRETADGRNRLTTDRCYLEIPRVP